MATKNHTRDTQRPKQGKALTVKAEEQDVYADMPNHELVKHHTVMIKAIQAQMEITAIGVDIQDQLDHQKELRENVSDVLLNAAKQFCTNDDFDDKLFLSWCEAEQQWAKSREAGQYHVDKIPHVWSNTKSIIKKAWEDNRLNPYDYSSITALRDAHREANKAKKVKAEREASQSEGRAYLEDKLPEHVDRRFAELLAAVAAIHSRADGKLQSQMTQHLNDWVKELKKVANLMGVDDAVPPADASEDEESNEAKEESVH